MRRRLRNLLLGALLLASSCDPVFAEITVRDGAYWFNGVRQERVVGRSSFKLGPAVSYHFAGKGGGHYTLGKAHEWVTFNQDLGFQILRVFLETQGWQWSRDRETEAWGLTYCEPESRRDNGVPDDCMFGSEPIDQGFWHVPTLRGAARVPDMHGIGKKALRWFFETSQETGMAFELVANATVKHEGVSIGQQTHVIRQTLNEAAHLQREFPQALVIVNFINEFDAHDDPMWSLADIRLLAVRANRCKHDDGRTRQALTFTWQQVGDDWEMHCGDGFYAEQWPGHPIAIDQGGENFFTYEVGPEADRYKNGWVHPSRGPRWETWPTPEQLAELRAASNGQPVGASESMYFVEPEDIDRARIWYRTAGDGRASGWTTDWPTYRQFIEHAISKVDYFIVHDEKGIQSRVDWPRASTRVDRWAREFFETGGGGPPPPPPPPPDQWPPADPADRPYDDEVLSAYAEILGRELAAIDLEGRIHWNERLERYYTTADDAVPGPDASSVEQMRDAMRSSGEFRAKNFGPWSIDAEPDPAPACPALPECANSGGSWNADSCWCDCPAGSVFLEDVGCEAPLPPPETSYMPAWDDIKDERFRRAPHLSATYRAALRSIEQQLTWDGIRNPGKALATNGYSWPYRRGNAVVTRDQALDLVARSTELLKRLRHFVTFDQSSSPPRAEAIGGTWLRGRTRVKAFESWHAQLVELFPLLEAANGISNPEGPI